MPQRLQPIINSPAFQRIIVSTILVAALAAGISTYPSLASRFAHQLLLLDIFVLSIFGAEIILKLAVRWPRPLSFFRDGWNCFDFLIVAACFLPATGQFAAAFRLFRLLRVLRLITTIPRLQLLVNAMLKAIPSMGYVMMLLFLLFYVYSVMGVFILGPHDPQNFGSLWASLLSLFKVLTLENWIDFLDIQEDAALSGSPPHALIAPAYFITFIILGTMVMLNLVIGVIINAMDEAQRETANRALSNFLSQDSQHRDPGEKRTHQIRHLQAQLDQIAKQLNQFH